jgi:transposase InsO family protein
MESQKSNHSISLMSRMLGISRSGYYRWKDRPPSARHQRREVVKSAVIDTYYDFKGRYGAPRLTQELNAIGISCSQNHVAQLLRESGLKARNGKGFKHSKSSSSNYNVSENLLRRDFSAQKPNEKWVTDITYIYVNGKWLYLSVVIDLFSRYIVGWALDRYMTESLICDALDMAIARRNIGEDLLVHSDRGVQYRSHRYQKKLLSYGCRISMSRKGNCWDNAVVESFFSRLKVELIFAEKFTTFEHARSAIFEYIEIFYNRKRRHSAIKNMSPLQFEQLG